MEKMVAADGGSDPLFMAGCEWWMGVVQEGGLVSSALLFLTLIRSDSRTLCTL